MFVMYCFSVLLQRKKLNIDEESGSLGFGGVFFPFTCSGFAQQPE